jgi:DNA repair exonuclease SbcCD ATPase subunit
MNKKELEQRVSDLENKMGAFENIRLKYITKGGAVKMISWGKDYKLWDVTKKLEYAEALASSMNEACELIQNERNEYSKKNESLLAMLEQAEKEMHTIKNTNRIVITASNEEKQGLIKTIRELESKLIDAENQLEIMGATIN